MWHAPSGQQVKRSLPGVDSCVTVMLPERATLLPGIQILKFPKLGACTCMGAVARLL